MPPAPTPQAPASSRQCNRVTRMVTEVATEPTRPIPGHDVARQPTIAAPKSGPSEPSALGRICSERE